MTELTTINKADIKVNARELRELRDAGIRRVCNRWGYDTLRTGIDLDLQCDEAIIALLQGFDLEQIVAHVDADHLGAREAVQELTRLYEQRHGVAA